jgi:hypothetical protein
MTTLLQTVETFRHEALLYAGEVCFLTGTLPFIREGIAAGEPVLVVVSAAKIGATWSSCAPSPPGRCCGCTWWVDNTATPPHVGGVAGGVACYWASIGRTLAAWGPLGPWATSNSTVWPSFSER